MGSIDTIFDIAEVVMILAIIIGVTVLMVTMPPALRHKGHLWQLPLIAAGIIVGGQMMAHPDTVIAVLAFMFGDR